MRTVTVTLWRVERLPNSTNGNPRYRLMCTGDNGGMRTWSADYVTQSDNLAITEAVEVIAHDLAYATAVSVVLGLTRANRVETIARAS